MAGTGCELGAGCALDSGCTLSADFAIVQQELVERAVVLPGLSQSACWR